MQLKDNGNWEERSLSYLCRAFDQLAIGTDYSTIKPVCHISFLDFPLSHNANKFHSIYQLKNIKNNAIYSDKLTLSVINLNQTSNAGAEDIDSGLVDWITFFKVTDWKEVLPLAERNPDIAHAAETMYSFSEIAALYHEAWLREDEARVQRTIEINAEKKGAEKSEKRFSTLTSFLLSNGQTDELNRALADTDYLHQLYEKYNI